MLSWLFPDTCELCGGPGGGSTICPNCRAALRRVPRPICRHCGTPVNGGQADALHCPSCEGTLRSFRFARAALGFSEQGLELVHALKYHHANHLAPALAPLLAELWDTTPELREHDDWVLIPVPVTESRLQERGYNQAEELARALGRLNHLRLLQPLQRCDTGVRSQTRLTAKQRVSNALKAYSAQRAYASGRRALPPHLLLVDDVMTTGSTLRACADVLRRLSPSADIGALALMRMGA